MFLFLGINDVWHNIICMVTCLYMMVFRFKVPNVGCPLLEALVSDLEAACFFLARGGGVCDGMEDL